MLYLMLYCTFTMLYSTGRSKGNITTGKLRKPAQPRTRVMELPWNRLDWRSVVLYSMQYTMVYNI